MGGRIGVSVEAITSTVGDGGIGVGTGVSVEIIISVAAVVGDSICVGCGVKVAAIVGDAESIINVAVGVAVGSDTLAAWD